MNVLEILPRARYNLKSSYAEKYFKIIEDVGSNVDGSVLTRVKCF